MKFVGRIHTPRQKNVGLGSSSSSNKHLAGESDDWLSEFPPDIQRNILSFLPTIDAARTDFTSKTWRTTWNSVPKLIFEYYQFLGIYNRIVQKRGTFVRFVNHALTCHDKSDVNVFELWLWPSLDDSILSTIGGSCLP